LRGLITRGKCGVASPRGVINIHDATLRIMRIVRRGISSRISNRYMGHLERLLIGCVRIALRESHDLTTWRGHKIGNRR
jgi:hypothetical protein